MSLSTLRSSERLRAMQANQNANQTGQRNGVERAVRENNENNVADAVAVANPPQIGVRRQLQYQCSCKESNRNWERFPGCGYDGGNDFQNQAGQGGCVHRNLETLKVVWRDQLARLKRMLPFLLKDAIYRALTFDVTNQTNLNVSQISYDDKMNLARNGLYNTKVFRCHYSRYSIRCAFCDFQVNDDNGRAELNANRIKYLHSKSSPHCPMQYRQFMDMFSGNKDHMHNWGLFGLKSVGPRSFSDQRWTGSPLKLDAKPRKERRGGLQTCIICMYKRVNVLQSCNHAVVCSDCWQSKSNVPVCCVCKRDVVWYKKITLVLKQYRITFNEEVANQSLAEILDGENDVEMEEGEIRRSGNVVEEGNGEEEEEEDDEEGISSSEGSLGGLNGGEVSDDIIEESDEAERDYLERVHRETEEEYANAMAREAQESEDWQRERRERENRENENPNSQQSVTTPQQQQQQQQQPQLQLHRQIEQTISVQPDSSDNDMLRVHFQNSATSFPSSESIGEFSMYSFFENRWKERFEWNKYIYLN